MTGVAVTGWSVHLPASAGDLRQLAGLPVLAPGCPPDQAHTILGRKGLLYKEPATRLALCAVHRALGLSDGQRPQTPMRTDTAVVAASNLGNVQTVVEVARTVAREGGRGVSPMSAPNASSNVIASSVALWFRFGGPNLMVCSGATAGLDAIALGALLIRSGRAKRVIVVGAEPDDEIALAVHRQREPDDAIGRAVHRQREPDDAAGRAVPRQREPGLRASAPALRAAAACVILQADDPASGPAARLSMVEHDSAAALRWPAQPAAIVGPGGIDPMAAWGDCYGAQGVLQVALAAQLAGSTGEPVGVRCGSDIDGWRAAWLQPATQLRAVPRPATPQLAALPMAGAHPAGQQPVGWSS